MCGSFDEVLKRGRGSPRLSQLPTFEGHKDRDARVRIAYDYGTDLVSSASSYPTYAVPVFPMVRDGATCNVLTDLQKYPEPGGRLRVIALFVGV